MNPLKNVSILLVKAPNPLVAAPLPLEAHFPHDFVEYHEGPFSTIDDYVLVFLYVLFYLILYLFACCILGCCFGFLCAAIPHYYHIIHDYYWPPPVPRRRLMDPFVALGQMIADRVNGRRRDNFRGQSEMVPFQGQSLMDSFLFKPYFGYVPRHRKEWVEGYEIGNVIELVVFLVDDFSGIVNKDSILIRMARMYRLVTNKSVYGFIVGTAVDGEYTFIEYLINLFMKEFDSNYIGQAGLDDLTNGLKYINEQSHNYMALLECDIGRKILTFCSLILCVPAINSLGITPEKFGYQEAAEYFLRANYYKAGMSVPGLIIESASSILLKVIEVKERGLGCLYVSRADHMEFEEAYYWIKKNKDNFANRTDVINAKGESDPFTLEGYLNKCCHALDLVSKILPTLKSNRWARDRLERQRDTILVCQNDCSSELRANERRPCPYAVMLCGPPSIGKTTIKEILLQQFHNTDNRTGRFEVPYNTNSVYNYNPDDDFYSGFSTAHTSIVVDDVAQKAPDIMKQLAGDDIKDLIRIVNAQPYTPNQAELHKKGKVPMRCRYVVGTTNIADLSAQHVYACPGAVYRRFLFVHCTVKPQYRQEFGTGLAGDKMDPTNLDLWDFKVIRHYPAGNTRSVVTKYFNASETKRTGHFVWDEMSSERSTCDIRDVCQFINHDLVKHWLAQDCSDKGVDSIYQSETCSCGLPLVLCNNNCWTAQSSMTDEWPRYVVYLFLVWLLYLSVPLTIWLLFLGAFAYKFIDHNWFRLQLLFLVYPIIVFSTCQEMIWPTQMPGHERFLIRVAMRVIPHLPHNDFYRRFTPYIPGWVLIRLSKGYLAEWIDFSFIKINNGYDYFMNVVVRSWKFKVAVAAITAFAVLRKMNSYSKLFSGESVMSKMPEPDAHEKVRINYWKRANNIGVFPNEGSTVTSYDLNNQAMLNTVLMSVEYKPKNTVVNNNAFIVTGNLLVTTAHWYLQWYSKEFEVKVTLKRLNKDGNYSSISFKLDKTNMYIDHKRDLLYFRSNRILPGRDMIKFLPSKKEEIHVNSTGVMHYVDKQTQLHDHSDLKRIYKDESARSYTFHDLTLDASDCLIDLHTKTTVEGLCGSPVIALQGNNKMIAGIHCAGSGLKGMIRPLYREDVLDVDKAIAAFIPLNDADNDIAFVAHSAGNTITAVHPKCPTNGLEGEYHVIGGSALPRSKPRSRVGPSMFQAESLEFYKTRGFPEVLHTSPIACNPKEAMLLTLTSVVTNANFAQKDIAFVVDCMSTEFIGKFSKTMLNRLHPYPMDVAINGCDGIPYIDRLNLTTSGGYGHPGPKRKHFILCEPDEYHMVKYDINDDIRAEYQYIIDQYKKGEEANPVFKCSFKDEPITFDKAKRNKVRIFSGSPVAFSLVMRQYLLCIIREFVGHSRLNFEMAIGANAYGVDWEEIYQKVITHGADRCFAGDYKSFDKQMAPELIMAAFEIISRILAKAGWDATDLLYIRGIATDVAFPTTDLFGTLVQFYGSNPSGHVLTTPINSLVNSLYMRLACKKIFENNGYTLGTTGQNTGKYVNFTRFNDIMSLVTYGDDNCGSISPRFPFINHTSIQEALGSYGVIYTMDQKEAQSVGLVSVEDITFLKRSFVYSEKEKRIIAPLTEESLFKTLTVWTYSGAISKEEQAAAVLESVNSEYFFYGVEIFQDRHEFLQRIAAKYELNLWMVRGRLMNYEEIRFQVGLSDIEPETFLPISPRQSGPFKRQDLSL